MRLISHTVLFTLLMLVVGCSKTGNQSLADKAEGNTEAYERQPVNAVEQARPTIMVVPSDILLKRYGALTSQKTNGVSVNQYDYNKYLVSNSDNKAVLSLIAGVFVDNNYPVQDFEQTLKQLSVNEALDKADDIGKDLKTELLTSAQPDLIVELDYAKNMNMRGNPDPKYSYTINVIDPYTNSVIATATQSELKGKNLNKALSSPIRKDLKKMSADITKSFSDVLKRGRNITVRINVASSSPINLDSRSITGRTYSDWIVDYVKTHTVKGAYKLQRNTSKELYFENCRIKLLNDDNTQYGVYDWARDMCDALYANLGVEASNRAQGLGQVVITINGLKQ